ncbi:MAG: CmcJ/NvfI family oxidoreductase [Pseudomonadales bacterium]
MGEHRAIACRAEMNYLGENITVTIEDGRADPALTLTAARLDDDAGWTRRGFALYRHRSSVTDWTDEDAIDQLHRREIAETAQALTGCTHALPYPAILRNPAMAETVADYAPIHFVHSDFTEDYGRMIGDPERTYQTFLGPLLASEGLPEDCVRRASRRLVLQFWRNVGPERADAPLAICDATTVPERDLERSWVESYGGGSFGFETFGVRGDRADAHRWFTFPSMTKDETLLFRTYDSTLAECGEAFWTPHSAFLDPAIAPEETARRASVEMRVLCLWT